MQVAKANYIRKVNVNRHLPSDDQGYEKTFEEFK
jgi:hypothetical protein